LGTCLPCFERKDGHASTGVVPIYRPISDLVVVTNLSLVNEVETSRYASAIHLIGQADENKVLKTRSENSNCKLGIKFEFTARDTTQQTHLAALAFATIANRWHALLDECS